MLMLDFMRRNARSWGIKVALGIICLVFVFFMGGGGRLGAGGRPLAVVGDTPVTVTEYQLARQRNEAYFASQYGGQLTPEIRRALDIPGLTLRQLVEAAVLRQEADRIGLQVPDEAVRSAIQEIDSFHVDNTFSPTRYRDVLRAQGLNTGGFERSMREELLSNQLTGLIRLGAQASEEEAYQSYAERSRTVSLSYVAVPGADLEPEGDLDEEGLAAHFQESIENYRLPESVKVRYLAFTPDVFLDEVEPDDEQIEEYYELNKDSEFTTEEKVAARHILKKFAEDADDETRQAVRKTAEALLTRVKDGEDFAELATAESEDAGSAIKGGDLGYFGRGRMVEPFENSAFSLGVGQTSDLVESRFGFHIIHVYDRNEAGTSNLEDVRASIVSKLSRSAAADLAFDAAASDAAAAADGTSLDVLASERGIDIQSTPLLGKGDIVPGLGPQPALVDAALDLGTKGDVSEAVKVGDGYYILELAERRESYLPQVGRRSRRCRGRLSQASGRDGRAGARRRFAGTAA